MQNNSILPSEPWVQKDSVDPLSKRLAARQPASVFGTARHACFVYADDAFVGALSEGARAYINTLPAPPAPNTPGAPPPAEVPAVPSHVATEIFEFANDTLLQDLQAPAVDAMMRGIQIPQALAYLHTAATELGFRDGGYRLLRDRCAAWLGKTFCAMRHTPSYRWLPSAQQEVIDKALHAHADRALRKGTREELRDLVDLIRHHIRRGGVTRPMLDKPHVWAWLCCDAPANVWQALQNRGLDLETLATENRALAFRYAVRAGRDDLVTLMMQATAPSKRDILWNAGNQDAIRAALTTENHHVLVALLSQLGPQERREVADNLDAWEAAARSQNSRLLGAMRAWLPTNPATEFEALMGLVEGRHVQSVHRMLADAPNVASMLTREHYMAFHAACMQSNPALVHTFLGHAEKALESDTLADMLRVGFGQAACSESLDSAYVENLMGWLEQSAKRHGVDLFAGFGHQTLARVCQAGHAAVVRRVLQRTDIRTHASWLDMQADVDRRHPTLLTAACRTGQGAVVDALFKWAESIREPSTMLLHNRGAALLGATQSGDAALVNKLVQLAQQAPEAWQAWLARRCSVVLYHAMACNTPGVLFTWLRLISAQQLRDALQQGLLVQGALHAGASKTLEALFQVADAVAPQLVPHMLHEALRADPEGDIPLGTAWRNGGTEAADIVLNRLTPAGYKAALKISFEDLCKTDGAYFLRHWDQLAPSEQSALQTSNFWAQLPIQTSPEVALYFIQRDFEAFDQALAPLPDLALSPQACKSIEAVVHAVPSAARQRVIEAWGPSIMAEALESEHAGMWSLVQHLPGDVALRLMLPHEEALRSQPYGVVAHQATTRLVLERAWNKAPDIAPLGEMAREIMLEDDNIGLLRELVASHPDALQEDATRRLLHPHDPVWAMLRPRIADYLLAKRY